jgi:hypothetical protein
MTSYINLTTNEYPRHVGDIELAPNDKFAHVEWVEMPEFDISTQRCKEGFPIEADGTWYMTWIVRDATQEEIDLANIPFDPLK